MKGVLKKIAAISAATFLLTASFVTAGYIYSLITKKSSLPPINSARLSSEEKSTQKDNSSASLLSREDMLENALKSVVGISSEDPLKKEKGSSVKYMGSGVLVSDDGYILTNQHVVGARPERVEVTLHSGESKDGKTVWSSRALDLAVVKIDAKGYVFSKMGDAKNLRVGENVVAIGNPLSMQFERTVTAGIVSALGRNINIENDSGDSSYMEDLIQTDASINPGNSGGPLLNSNGEVVGINTVKVSSAEAMGFAVPVNVCVPIIERLRNVGLFKTPYLGLYAYTRAAARYMGETADFEKGLFVAKLDSTGPAFAAGIRYGDIILTLGEKEVSSMLELREELYKRQSGEALPVEFMRNGSVRRVSVMLSLLE